MMQQQSQVAREPKRRRLWRALLRDVRLRNKLLFAFFLAIFLPLVVFNQFTFRVVNDIVERQIIFSATQAFQQTSDFLAYKLHKIISVSDSIAVNSMVSGILEKDAETYSLPDQYADLHTLRMYLSSFHDVSDIYNICLYLRDEVVHAPEDDDISSFSHAQASAWFRRLPGASSRALMCPPVAVGGFSPNQPLMLSVVRRITSTQDYLTPIGYVRIDFWESDVRTMLTGANSVSGSLTYIRDSDDRIISATDGDALSTLRLNLAQIEALRTASGWVEDTVRGQAVYARASQIPDTDWTIITLIPAERIFEEIVALRNRMMLTMLLVGLLSFLLSAMMVANFAHRLRGLSQRMADVSDATVPLHSAEEESRDEIGHLTRSFHYMMGRIALLNQEKTRDALELRDAELRALQAQINPHFLYNTLDMINWMSYDDRAPDIRQAVRALSAFYKLSLSQGKSVVSLREELEHVAQYIKIQNLRFGDQIAYSAECPEELLDLRILKITLQPLVENAVLHGVLAKPSKSGAVKLTVCRTNEAVHIVIADDGMGMTHERQEALFGTVEEAAPGVGFGLKNIHHRLMLYYGPQHGLTIDSEPGKGTRVTVSVPGE
ncbi:MAG: sensor histidine kinase [Clostridia bacterium]|nr:sensor histidine kinase [Clostridia bacterium]